MGRPHEILVEPVAESGLFEPIGGYRDEEAARWQARDLARERPGHRAVVVDEHRDQRVYQVFYDERAQRFRATGWS